MSSRRSTSSDWKPNLAILISVASLVFSFYQACQTSEHFHTLNDPEVLLDDVVIDTTFSTTQCKIAVVFSNHGNTVAQNVTVIASLASPSTIEGFNSANSVSSPVILVMAPHDTKQISALLSKRSLDSIMTKKLLVFLTLDISFEDKSGEHFECHVKEKYDFDYRKFLLIESRPKQRN